MSAQNAPLPRLSDGKIDVANSFFKKSQLTKEKKTTPNCIVNPWVTFFFDGTNNNKDRDLTEAMQAGKPRKLCEHSNIVSLFEIAKNNPISHLFSHYVQGVGTIFNNIGEEEPDDKGLAMAKGGSKRISYAIFQLCNSISYSFNKKRIFSIDDFKKGLPVEKISTEPANANIFTALPSDVKKALEKLSITIGDNKTKPTIGIVNVAVFGFSRGAAEARSFARVLELCCEKKGDDWLFAKCIPIRLYFMGIFDTVASVGLAHSTPAIGRAPGKSADGVIDGQMDWAKPFFLKVTDFTKMCRHYVAAHEIRYSFPLTSIRYSDGSTPTNAIEVVYPGSHSDVGGGYGPGDQGKSIGSRSKLLSQIPLLNMYNDAISAGVPLNSLASLKEDDPLKQDFICDQALLQRFNAYMAWAGGSGSLVEDKLYNHLKKYWQWRFATSAHFMQQDCMKKLSKSTGRGSRADKQDLEDMRASEQDWIKDSQSPNGLSSDEVKELREIQRQAQQTKIPQQVHDFFDQHVHDSHASFYMLGPTTVWQRKKHVALAMKRRERIQKNGPMRIGQSGYPTGELPLFPYEDALLKNCPSQSTDPAKIDVSNFPVVTDADFPAMARAEGIPSQVASAMTNTRREVGGHAHQRATFVGSKAIYGKPKHSKVN